MISYFIYLFLVLFAYQKAPLYECIYTEERIMIDGEITEPIWQNIPFLSPLKDIEDAKSSLPYHTTSIQLCWDSVNLYIAATVEDNHIWATYQEDEMPLYEQDVFELFLDPDRDGKDYFEIEINPLGAIWDLQLTKGYRYGGKAHSEWTCKGLKKEICINGSINQSEDRDQAWTLEMAIPFTSICHSLPKEGSIWSANFMRIDWGLTIKKKQYIQSKKNGQIDASKANIWTWAEQGIRDVHLPEKWGKIYFVRK